MTFPALRYICDEGCLLSKLLDQFDVIVVDERQDLMSAQELRLLCQGSKPVVMIGDTLQEINSFRNDPPCDKCEFESEQRPTLPPSIEWYSSWRLDQQTVRFLEYRFGCRMHSFRPETEEISIRWQEELQVPENTLVLCRGNKGVVEVARQHSQCYVVGGNDLATRLENASQDKTMVTPMSMYARQLKLEGDLENVCILLRNRNIDLANVKSSAVCTVHKAKGFEYDHCAIYHDLLDKVDYDNSTEQNIRFVAFTRHKKSLTIMCNVPNHVT
jgi:superfamily I DNA/RNA helicase